MLRPQHTLNKLDEHNPPLNPRLCIVGLSPLWYLSVFAFETSLIQCWIWMKILEPREKPSDDVGPCDRQARKTQDQRLGWSSWKGWHCGGGGWEGGLCTRILDKGQALCFEKQKAKESSKYFKGKVYIPCICTSDRLLTKVPKLWVGTLKVLGENCGFCMELYLHVAGSPSCSFAHQVALSIYQSSSIADILYLSIQTIQAFKISAF